MQYFDVFVVLAQFQYLVFVIVQVKNGCPGKIFCANGIGRKHKVDTRVLHFADVLIHTSKAARMRNGRIEQQIGGAFIIIGEV